MLSALRLSTVRSTAALKLVAPASVRFNSSTTVAPKVKANALINALPGNSLVSKTGYVTLTTALAGAGISSELFVLNEEVVILGSFIIFAGYVSNLLREPYSSWADGQIKVRNPPRPSSRRLAAASRCIRYFFFFYYFPHPSASLSLAPCLLAT